MELTQEQVDTIDSVCRTLAAKFRKFGIWSQDDLIQECWGAALQRLPQYSEERGSLGSFMYKALYNKLINLRRDNFYDPRETATPDKNRVRNPASGDVYVDIKLDGDPLETLIMKEGAALIEGMDFEQAAKALGCPHLSEKVCAKCGASKQPSHFDDNPKAQDGKRQTCRLCLKGKRCGRCQRRKPLESFAKNKRARDGRQAWCRSCYASYHQEGREAS